MGDKEVFKYQDIVLQESDLDTLREGCYLNDQIMAFYFTYLASSFDTEPDTLLVAPSLSLWIANCEDPKFVEEYAQSCKMSSRRFVVFAVNDNEDFCGGDGGNHWSILVYDRMRHSFLHFDSMKGVNASPAMKICDALKEFMGPGGESSRPRASKQRNKKKSVPAVNRGLKATVPPVTGELEANALSGLPKFVECKTPQQTNGCDCGLYVLAIARAVCQWCSQEHNKTDIISTIQKNVDHSVEINMRSEVLDIIREMAKTVI